MGFERLTGFREISPGNVRQNIAVEDRVVISRANGRSWVFGRLETPSLADWRERVRTHRRPASG